MRFCISGEDFNPSYITEKLNVNPTYIKSKSSFPTQSIVHGLAATIWRFEVIEKDCKSLSIPFNKIQVLFANKVIDIKSLKDNLDLKVYFEIIIHAQEMSIPEIILSQNNIDFLASINASVGFDIYSYH